MSYPNNIDSFKRLKNRGDTITEQLNLVANSSSFYITTAYDILSSVNFSSIYTVEVYNTPSAGQYRVIYNSNKIELGPLAADSNITLTYKTAGSPISASNINDTYESIENIEETLGINPQGTYATVKSRLDALESSTSLVPVFDVFEGDGSTTDYTLTNIPISINHTLLFVAGLFRIPGQEYILASNKIIFTGEPPAIGDKIIVWYFKQ